jgi:hypothetical protein
MPKDPPLFTTRRMPLAAAVLGAGGALPFVGLLVAAWRSWEPFGRSPTLVLALYAVVILSFMGAVHWGLAMAGRAPWRDAAWSYGVSVMPALFGWFSIAFLPITVALQAMAAAFVLLLVYDLRAVRLGIAPPWYSGLRIPLTAIVVPCLLMASFLRVT